jgi:hypothetical protein
LVSPLGTWSNLLSFASFLTFSSKTLKSILNKRKWNLFQNVSNFYSFASCKCQKLYNEYESLQRKSDIY